MLVPFAVHYRAENKIESFASAIVVAVFGNRFAYEQIEPVLRQQQTIFWCLGSPVQLISET